MLLVIQKWPLGTLVGPERPGEGYWDGPGRWPAQPGRPGRLLALKGPKSMLLLH